MVAVCFYFQVHQPFRIKPYKIFDIGHDSKYFDKQKNIEIMDKVANKCYLPMNYLLLELINKHKGKFKVAFSISGVAIEQMEKYAPHVLESFKKLSRSGCVEFLSETYHHSLSFLYSKEEFKEQIKIHNKKIKEHFNVKPKIFRNTELAYSNELGNFIENMGYKGVLAEGWDPILGYRSANYLYKPKNSKKKISLFLKNYKLSDDIAFRFSNKAWEQWPLTTEKFSHWINRANGNGEIINLFMDYETFGEHQWEDTGIFEFMKQLPQEILKNPHNSFVTPSEAIKRFEKRDEIDIPHILTWADTERDLSAWLGNNLQNEASYEIFKMEKDVKELKDKEILEKWRKLTTSDHFYYMSTKYSEDGDVHKYFSAYDSPYDAYVYFMNIMRDLKMRVAQLKEKKRELKTNKVSNIS